MDGGDPIGFWLIDDEDPATDLQRGHPLEYMQIATIERVTNIPFRAAGKLDAGARDSAMYRAHGVS